MSEHDTSHKRPVAANPALFLTALACSLTGATVAASLGACVLTCVLAYVASGIAGLLTAAFASALSATSMPRTLCKPETCVRVL